MCQWIDIITVKSVENNQDGSEQVSQFSAGKLSDARSGSGVSETAEQDVAGSSQALSDVAAPETAALRVGEVRQTRLSKRGRAMSSSRLLVLETLEAQTVPVPITALIQRVQLHENTVRGHLTALLHDGFVGREADISDGRGRPSWLWFAREPAHASASEIEYGGLASVLAESISITSQQPALDALTAGQSWGKKIAAQKSLPARAPQNGAAEYASAVLSEFGFAPQTLGPEIVELRRCPILDVATSYPDVVCNVHLGLVQGVLESAGHNSTGSSLKPFSAPGVCTLRLPASTAPRIEHP